MASRTPPKMRTRSEMTQQNTGATTGYEVELWQMADTLRGLMDAAEYKHVVLGLIFLKQVLCCHGTSERFGRTPPLSRSMRDCPKSGDRRKTGVNPKTFFVRKNPCWGLFTALQRAIAACLRAFLNI